MSLIFHLSKREISFDNEFKKTVLIQLCKDEWHASVKSIDKYN